MRIHYRWMQSLAAALFLVGSASAQASFEAQWHQVSQEWLEGPFHANRSQDWTLSNGRLECLEGKASRPMRTVHLLSHRIQDAGAGLHMDVVTGRADRRMAPASDSWTGFLIGAGHNQQEVEEAASIYESPSERGGLIAGIDGSGRAFFRRFDTRAMPVVGKMGDGPGALPDSVILRLQMDRRVSGYRLSLLVTDARTGQEVSRAILDSYPGEKLAGNVALVSHPGTSGGRYWFSEWQVEGTSLAEVPAAPDPEEVVSSE